VLYKDTSYTRGQSVANLGRLWPLELPIQWTSRLFLEVMRAERETDYPPPYTAKVKNMWSYASDPQYFFVLKCLSKRSDGFICLQALTSLVDRVLVFRVTPYELVGA
jgi:hypothetical protein